MSGTTTTVTTQDEPPTVRKEPSASTSATTATAIVIILNWIVKSRYAVDIPADVGMSIGVVLMGFAHLAQMAWFYYTDARVQPKIPLPPQQVDTGTPAAPVTSVTRTTTTGTLPQTTLVIPAPPSPQPTLAP